MDSPRCQAQPRELVESYSLLHRECATVRRPCSPDEVAAVFSEARGGGCRVTLRAGGHSFDAQSLGDEIVVSLSALDHIELLLSDDPAYGRVRVGPGATWGAILRTLERHGLVAAITVTSSHATAGGTLSGDCLSRLSAAYGKEGCWIESFDLLTITGDSYTCSATENEDEYCGVIGGLGYLGAVTSITYRVLRVTKPSHPVGVATVARKYSSLDELAEHLVPTVREIAKPGAPAAEPLVGIWAVVVPRLGRDPSALVFTSKLVPSSVRRRMLLHRTGRLMRGVRILVEWALRRPSWARVFWPACYHANRDGAEYIDDLPGFTFIMDAHTTAKRIARRVGVTNTTIQQTFVIPLDGLPRGIVEAAQWDLVATRKLRDWLSAADAAFSARGLAPTLQDVMFINDDKPFLLSANAGMPGFAMSYAFETSDEVTLCEVRNVLAALSDKLHTDFGGRVHLVKNVHASPTTLRAMYEPNASTFFELKRKLDPQGQLCNAFLMRTFGDLYRATYPDPPAAQADAA